MANKLKLPQIDSNSKILSFDLETNGLHGQAFAIGAVVVDANDKIINEFTGRVQIKGDVDKWVQENVLPVIEDMPINYSSYEELREVFWKWFVAAKEESDYVVVSNGYPVEYRFLLDCQQANIEERYWEHPFPILDLTSLLIQIGIQSSPDKQDFVHEFLSLHNRKPHHPLQDATITALATFKAFRESGQNPSKNISL